MSADAGRAGQIRDPLAHGDVENAQAEGAEDGDRCRPACAAGAVP